MTFIDLIEEVLDDEPLDEVLTQAAGAAIVYKNRKKIIGATKKVAIAAAGAAGRGAVAAVRGAGRQISKRHGERQGANDRVRAAGREVDTQDRIRGAEKKARTKIKNREAKKITKKE